MIVGSSSSQPEPGTLLNRELSLMAPDWEKLGLTASEIDPVSRDADFKKLDWGSIRPTDFDAVIEYHNCAFLLVDFKSKGAPSKYGKSEAYLRGASAWWQAGREVLYVVLDVPAGIAKDEGGQFNPRGCIIREWWENGKGLEWPPFGGPFGELFEEWKSRIEPVGKAGRWSRLRQWRGVLAAFARLDDAGQKAFRRAIHAA
jgi:hypothetical protein